MLIGNVDSMSFQFTLTSENHDTQFRRRMKSATHAPSSVQVGQTMNEVAARWWFISSSARFAHSGVLLTAPVNCYSVPSGLRCIVAAFCAVLSYSSNKNYMIFRAQKYLKCCCISVDHGRHSLCILNCSVHNIQNFIQSSQRWPRRRQKIAA